MSLMTGCPACDCDRQMSVWNIKGFSYGEAMAITMKEKYKYVLCPDCGTLYRYECDVEGEDRYNEFYPELSVDENDIEKSRRKTVRSMIRKLRDEYYFMNKHKILTPFLRTVGGIWPVPYPYLLQYADRFSKGAKVLEIGAAKGIMSSYLKGCGVDIYAMEPFIPKTIQYASGLTVEKLGVEELYGEWDIIILHNVFEHLNSPVIALKKIYDHLNKDGICDIVIPAMGDMTRTYKEYSYIIQAPDHIGIYTDKAIRMMASKAGFNDILIEKAVKKIWYAKSILIKNNCSFSDSETQEQLTERMNESEKSELGQHYSDARKRERETGDYFHIVLHKEE